MLVSCWSATTSSSRASHAGGGFSGLSKRLGYVELKEITRQRHAADRQAVYDLAEGNAAPALQSYSAKRGRLILGESRADTMQRLVADWRSDKTEIEEKLILSSTNRQAATLNGSVSRSGNDEANSGKIPSRCRTVPKSTRAIACSLAKRQVVRGA